MVLFEGLKSKTTSTIHYHDWDPTQLNSVETEKEFTDLTQALIAFLEEEDAEREKLPSFKKEQIGHILLTLADLIRLPGVASKSDLSACLEVLGCESNRQTLERYLSILLSVEFIEEHLRSNQTLYVRNSSTAFIRYAYREGV
jgi:hypothetical protein